MCSSDLTGLACAARAADEVDFGVRKNAVDKIFALFALSHRVLPPQERKGAVERPLSMICMQRPGAL